MPIENRVGNQLDEDGSVLLAGEIYAGRPGRGDKMVHTTFSAAVDRDEWDANHIGGWRPGQVDAKIRGITYFFVWRLISPIFPLTYLSIPRISIYRVYKLIARQGRIKGMNNGNAHTH